MRKLLILVLALFTLGASSAFAQDDMMDMSTQWVGISSGYPLGVVFHYGIEDLLSEDLDLRINVSAIALGGGFSVVGGADALYNLDVDLDAPVGVYAGGGLNVGLSLGGGSAGFAFSARVLGGAEYMITDEFGAFGELRVGLGSFGGFTFIPSLALGVNYHF